jgi:hypothetical protein
MKKILLIMALMIGSTFVFNGCEDEVYITKPDHTPPSRPKGIYSVTADQAVYLYWEANDEKDFAEYRIYRKTDPESNKYYHLATVDTSAYTDHNVNNGDTYFYVVTAIDYDGIESDFSDVVQDTPRPEDTNWTLYDRFYKPESSGFSFAGPEILDWDDYYADIYLEYDTNLETFFLCVANDQTDIQDFGFTDNLDDVDWSPGEGWSNVGWVEVITGHSYIVWTADDNYAKLRISEIVDNTRLTFDWAYQVDPGNHELIPRPSHSDNYLRVAVKENK